MTRFMTLDFADGEREALLQKVIHSVAGTYRYVVTPNVDHVVKLLQGKVAANVYRGADLMICDSRILAHLARLKGKSLSLSRL